MLKFSLCYYSDEYILVTGTITVVGAGTNTADKAADRINK